MNCERLHAPLVTERKRHCRRHPTNATMSPLRPHPTKAAFVLKLDPDDGNGMLVPTPRYKSTLKAPNRRSTLSDALRLRAKSGQRGHVRGRNHKGFAQQPFRSLSSFHVNLMR